MLKIISRLAACLLAGVAAAAAAAQAQAPGQPATHRNAPSAPNVVAALPLPMFWTVMNGDSAAGTAALQRIRANWSNAYAPLLIELYGEMYPSAVKSEVARLLNEVSGLGTEGNYVTWYEWLWSIDAGLHPDYAGFKASLYERVDPRFREYFSQTAGEPLPTAIRLDEIRWGGVVRDGIPPLKNPRMIPAREATYLGQSDVIFGVAIGNDVRAYPKRILAWHEMVKDRIDGRDLNGVYCTLCGSMILYDPKVNGVHHELGTSGFLYRSNKLMYDHATKSLWSTLSGTPVVGPLVGKGIELTPLYVVTTTWKEWRARHPNTLVLSLETGHQRDYSEGAAYRNYFATDQLMFGVPKLDPRLPNKAEVLALRAPERIGAKAEQLAIAASHLAANPVFHGKVGGQDFVVLTDPSGANRVFASGPHRFTATADPDTIRDAHGRAWRWNEAALRGPAGLELKRLPAHRAFWFGWVAAYPATKLIR